MLISTAFNITSNELGYRGHENLDSPPLCNYGQVCEVGVTNSMTNDFPRDIVDMQEESGTIWIHKRVGC